MSEAERFLCKTRRQLRRLAFKSSGWMAIEPGLKQCYQRGQETNALAVREPTPENFHAWRKQVKTFWYQLQLVCPKRSREAQAFIDRVAQGDGEGFIGFWETAVRAELAADPQLLDL